MSKTFQEKRAHLVNTIRKINIQWMPQVEPWPDDELNEYIAEVLVKYRDKLDEAIKCFDSVLIRGKTVVVPLGNGGKGV